MPTVKLTKRTVDRIEPSKSLTYFFDADLSGFFLRVSPSGARAWGFQYRAGSGRGAEKRRIAIAAFGTLTPEEARAAARSLAADVAKGQDPADVKARKAKEMRITAMIDLYEKEGCFIQRGIRLGQPMKPMTAKYTVARLRNHVVPILGAKRVTEVTPADIERLAREITAGKTASDRKTAPRTRIKVRGGGGAAHKVIRDLSAVFTFAVRQRIAIENPVTTAAVRKTDNRRERFLSLEDPRVLSALVRAVVEHAQEGCAAA